MTIFTITKDNNITTFSSAEEVANYPEAEQFTSEEELAELAANWPAARLVEIWNGLPGITPLKKFTDRATAITRIWKAIQVLAEPVASRATPEIADDAAPAGPEDRIAAVSVETPEAPTPETQQEADVAPQAADVVPIVESFTNQAAPSGQPPKAPREGSKADIVLALLKRKGGATLQELMTATGWQAHSIRGFLSGTVRKKMGLEFASTKDEAGERTYSITA